MYDQSLVTRSAAVIIRLVAGQSQYLFNVTTFRNKTIQKIEVTDSTGLGLVNAPDGSTLAATSLVAQSYVQLVSANNTTDAVIQAMPASRLMPSVSTGIGAGLPNYNPIILSGDMNFNIENSYLFFPDPSVINSGVAGQSVYLQVWYNDVPQEN
jgi:hypothetical protein